MNKEIEKEVNKDETENKQNENKAEEDKHNLEEKLEELLRNGWIMLPESCTLPCI
jgi:hypothetical protein